MLIRSIEEIQNAVPVADTLVWNKVKPWVMNAQVNYLRTILGKDLILELETAMEATPSEIQQELIDHVQFALGNLTMMDYLPLNMAVMGDSGNLESTPENSQSARQWVTVGQVKTMIANGFRRLEECIVFLEENVASFESWKESSYYKEGRKRLVPNALIFDEFYKIGESGWLYYQLLPSLKTVEDGPILGLLGSAFLAELRAKLASDGPEWSPVEQQLLDFLRSACANLAMARAIPRIAVEIGTTGITLQRTNTSQSVTAMEAATREDKADLIAQASADGKTALGQAKDWLYANAELFPTWKGSPAYQPDNSGPYENDPDSGIFVTGI